MVLLLVSLGVTNTAGVSCWFDWGVSLTASLRLLIIFLGSHVSKVSLGLCGDRRVSSNEGANPIVHSTLVCYLLLYHQPRQVSWPEPMWERITQENCKGIKT